MLSRMLTRSQMALLCLGLFLALALCGAWQAFAWGRTQLDTGALVCADTLRLHIRAASDAVADQSAKLRVRDAVLAVMMHTSRTRAAEYIAAGRVEINHLPLKAAHETAYAEDIFTVRGVGRFKLAAIGGKSRKDRLFISFYQY